MATVTVTYCWFVLSDSSVFVLITQKHELFVNAPLGSAVSFTASIGLRPRSLRVCTESRRASGRRGEFPLVPQIFARV